MTEQEAINVFKGFKFTPREMKAVAISIEALEKQIPKKPYLEGDGYADGAMVYDIWRCPNCDRAYEVDVDDYDYCPNCGQKLDLGDAE